MTTLSDYQVKTPDWREQLRKNKVRTRWVIAIFLLIYLILGLSIDIFLVNYFTHAPILNIFIAIINLQIFPYVTLIMIMIALVSLLVTYVFYDRIMLLGTHYREITPETAQSLSEKQLYNVVEEMKIAAGLNYLPKIYLINANYMNAFASGFSEKSAMIAVTSGLMEKLNRSELQAVLAHELSHIRHQDIKLTLTASVLANTILIVIDILFYNVIYGRRKQTDSRLVFVIIILRFVMPIITVILLLYLSRTREYMADSGCVELMRDNQPLAQALLKIHNDHKQNLNAYNQEYGATAHEDIRRAAYLYDPVVVGAEPVKSVASLFSTHPDLKQRLRAIGVEATD